MRKAHLAVLVHGWGAGHDDWWGGTRSALTSHPEFAAVDFYFHQFETQHFPRLFAVTRLIEFLGRPRHQELGELGQDLWANIKSENAERSYETIALFGHSFGGIVIADAISYASRRAAEGSGEDSVLLEKISAIALCCTPLGGAELAKTYTAIARVVGHNPHVRNLLLGDLGRRNAVNDFVHFASSRPGLITTFRATGDAVVKSAELSGPFKSAGLTVNEYVLQGTHSDCIQNIGPAETNRSKNFDRIVTWLRKSFENAPLRPRDLRENFNELIRKLQLEIEDEPFRSWRTLRANSDVSDNYILRLVLQRLIYAAARISPSALASANLWVAHCDTRGKIHLRSEEREGYFTTGQLIVFSGAIMAGENKVSIRANEVHDAGQNEGRNSAGALAYLRGKPQLVATDKTGFPSEIDRQVGVTHILGIPLYSKKHLNEMSSEEVDGAPLAITVDLNFEVQPSESEIRSLNENAQCLTEVFEKLHDVWLAGGVRVRL